MGAVDQNNSESVGARARPRAAFPTRAVLEAIYRFDLSDQAWLEGCGDVLVRHFDAVLPCGMFMVAGADGRPAPRALAPLFDIPFDEAAAITRSNVETLWGPMGPTGVWSREHPNRENNISRWLRARGAPVPAVFDAVILHGRNASGTGVGVGALVEGTWRKPLPPEMSGLSLHLAAAARLREAGLDAHPIAAVVDDKGRVVHATGAARSPHVREALRLAARGVDQARSRRVNAADILSLWQAVVAQRYTLAERFEADGRRYLVAIENVVTPAAVPHHPLAQLPERAQQVCALCAFGYANKDIGYALGLTSSTVATHLQRSKRALQVATRAELVVAVQQAMQMTAAARS